MTEEGVAPQVEETDVVTSVSIDVEDSFDVDLEEEGLGWRCALSDFDGPLPADAEELLRRMKEENKTVYDLIHDWELIQDPVVKIAMVRSGKRDGKPFREFSFAQWSASGS